MDKVVANKAAEPSRNLVRREDLGERILGYWDIGISEMKPSVFEISSYPAVLSFSTFFCAQ